MIMYILRYVSIQFKSVMSYLGQENFRCGQLYFLDFIILLCLFLQVFCLRSCVCRKDNFNG